MALGSSDARDAALDCLAAGIDGATDAAGAVANAETVDDATARDALARNDAYPVLEDAEALLRTGATGTNVNDLRVLVVEDGS